MSESLRACPFCGGKARREGRVIECERCGNRLEYFDAEEAIACWNARNVRDAVQTLAEAVKSGWYGER